MKSDLKIVCWPVSLTANPPANALTCNPRFAAHPIIASPMLAPGLLASGQTRLPIALIVWIHAPLNLGVPPACPTVVC